MNGRSDGCRKAHRRALWSRQDRGTAGGQSRRAPSGQKSCNPKRNIHRCTQKARPKRRTEPCAACVSSPRRVLPRPCSPAVGTRLDHWVVQFIGCSKLSQQIRHWRNEMSAGRLEAVSNGSAVTGRRGYSRCARSTVWKNWSSLPPP